MKKYIYFTITLLTTIPNCFSQRHIKNNADGSAYVPLRLYESVYKRHITKKDYDKLKINGQDTLILVEDFEKFKSKMSKSSNFKSESRTYMTLKSFKEHFKRPLTKADSLTFKFNKNDTLVLVKGYKPKGVSVPYEEIDSTLLEIYKDIVYRKHQSKKNKRKDYMIYWKKPIKLYFTKSVDKEYKEVIKKLSKKLTKEIDSLSISIVSRLEESNYLVYQIDKDHRYRYSPNLNKNTYIHYSAFWNDSKIFDTKLEINVAKFKNVKINKIYLMKAFIRSLGQFYNTSKVPCESVFSNCNGQKIKFGDLDLKLLKYHYSYGICKGTDLEKFEDQHKRAKESLRKGNKHSFIHQE
ncbi:hypothetical protein [Aureibaculum conchae]|uniref:hypothetical protein n=1 Tax=Aureibaculum sp. 2308TA14-22 TaxID=3108392 RepID=UPI00339554A8